jgi:hypothetical protein
VANALKEAERPSGVCNTRMEQRLSSLSVIGFSIGLFEQVSKAAALRGSCLIVVFI